MKKCKEHNFEEVEIDPSKNDELKSIRVITIFRLPGVCTICGMKEIDYFKEKSRKEEIERIKKYGLKEERIRKAQQIIEDYGLNSVDLFPYID